MLILHKLLELRDVVIGFRNEKIMLSLIWYGNK